MALEEYRKKRHFGRTPEPAGKRRRAGGDGFVVQKHDATRLHYDFRLELDGVLKSWAVPKGPSLDPADRRLAVETEDHPLEYADFEGIIPEGEYGGGTVLVWDRGTWTPHGDPRAGYAKGHLEFELAGEKLRGGWMLVRLRDRDEGKHNWLLIKRHDDAATGEDLTRARPESVLSGRSIEGVAGSADRVWHSDLPASEQAAPPAARRRRTRTAARSVAKLPGARRAALPDEVEPELAMLASSIAGDEEMIYEVKLDGYRILARVDGEGGVRLTTRNGKDWTDRFPTLASVLARGPSAAVLDGELVALDERGVSRFQALQNALSSGREGELVYFAFDLPYEGGYDLTGAALEDRKRALGEWLAGLPAAQTVVRATEHLRGDWREVRDEACRLGLEGVVAKRLGSRYRPGRGGDWLKLKCKARQELVVVGYTDPRGTRTGIGALLVGYYEGGELRYAGKVGTGLTTAMLGDLRRRLEARRLKEPLLRPVPRERGAHWVKPELVAEIEFTEWTDDGMLRHPSFVGMREDKDPRSIRRERPQSPPPASNEDRPAGRSAPRATSRERGALSESSPSAARTRRARRSAVRADEHGHEPRRVSRARTAAPGPPAGRDRRPAPDRSAPTLTHPDRVVFAALGATKRELADYMQAVADWMLPYVARRPLMLVRCPEGTGRECFHQKHLSRGMPEAIGRVPLEEGTGRKTSLYVEDAAGLAGLVQMNALEVHTWRARIDDIERPDELVLDLDPDTGLPWAELVAAARRTRDLVARLGLTSFVKTTGGKGLHVVVPLVPSAGWDELRAVAKGIAELLAADSGGRYVSVAGSRARQGGRIFVDYLRNSRGATAIAPFSPRARPEGTVAMPLAWDELEPRSRPSFDLRTALARLRRLRRDPWRGYGELRQSLVSGRDRSRRLEERPPS